MFKKYDDIVVRDWNGKFRPAKFIEYTPHDDRVCYIRYASQRFQTMVFVNNVFLKEIYLSPLFEAMKEEE